MKIKTRFALLAGCLMFLGATFTLGDAWLASDNNTSPVLDGRVLQFVNSPRWNIPEFCELHFWAWRNNPQGGYVDWKNPLCCDRQ